MKIHLLIIDPQKDFCQPANPALADMMEKMLGMETDMTRFIRNGGALCVPGADKDIVNLSRMINRLRKKIDDIHVTLDSHNEIDIAHPIFWVDSTGKHPDPFTIIGVDDVVKGKWRVSMNSPLAIEKGVNYVKTLATNGRYPLCIWPVHCVIGTIGHSIQDPLRNTLSAWERERFKKVGIVTKGSNIFTEHYSAVQADVPDPTDLENTGLNTQFLGDINKADIIGISGEALSHCVANTIRDIANNFGEENIKKLRLIEDTCSNVPGFENLGTDFVKEMTGRGMQRVKSTEFLA